MRFYCFLLPSPSSNDSFMWMKWILIKEKMMVGKKANPKRQHLSSPQVRHPIILHHVPTASNHPSPCSHSFCENSFKQLGITVCTFWLTTCHLFYNCHLNRWPLHNNKNHYFRTWQVQIKSSAQHKLQACCEKLPAKQQRSRWVMPVYTSLPWYSWHVGRIQQQGYRGHRLLRMHFFSSPHFICCQPRLSER